MYSIAAFHFFEAGDLLNKWQEARPFLYIGQSQYAQSLVRTMIESYALMLLHNDDLDANVLTELYELLEDHPPSDDPPLTKPSEAVSILRIHRATLGS